MAIHLVSAVRTNKQKQKTAPGGRLQSELHHSCHNDTGIRTILYVSNFSGPEMNSVATRGPSIFWATVCKTVRPILSDRCLSVCLSVLSVCPVLSVTFAHCGKTIGWIKIKLGMQVTQGLSSPSPKGTAPSNFRPISVAAKWLHRSRFHLIWR